MSTFTQITATTCFAALGLFALFMLTRWHAFQTASIVIFVMASIALFIGLIWGV